MRYISTRGEAPASTFEEVLLKGLAGDGGLFVPETWPRLEEAEWRALAGRPYAHVAMRLFSPYLGGAFSDDELRALLGRALRPFNSRLIAPLRQIAPEDFLLELFHGPTLAFKDVALQFLGEAFEAVLKRRGKRLTIIGATSGDTGSAAIEAIRGRETMEIFILHPEGRVSEVQRRQMTTADEPNVHNLAVHGTFDDCQRLVKEIFADQAFADELRLSGVNSINWARIMAQIVYFATAALALGAPGRPVHFVVPTGNFGDILAGYAAARMGLPIGRLVIATNANDILARALSTGRYETGVVAATTSPSMDIQVSSNFERLLFDACGRDAEIIRTLMESLKQTGAFTIPAGALGDVRARFAAFAASEEEVKTAILGAHLGEGLLLDPHTAVGAVALAKARASGEVPAGEPAVLLATAHAAKFPDAVEAAAGVRPSLPAAIAAKIAGEERFLRVPADARLIKDFIRSRVMPMGRSHGH